MPFTTPQPLVIFQAFSLNILLPAGSLLSLSGVSPLCTCNANCLLVAPTELQAQGLKQKCSRVLHKW